MTTVERSPDAPHRSVTQVGPGDFVKVGPQWVEIKQNSAHGEATTPRRWRIETEGGIYDMWDINAYAKREDMES